MQDTDATVADLRQQLEGALRNRAMLVAALLDELEPELGAERAEAALARALRRRGEGAGRRFLADCAPADFARLRERFIDFLPDHGCMFEIETTRCDAGGLGLKFRTCPVKAAYEAAGLTPERMQALLRISGAGDVGLFEGAGFAIRNDTWTPGDEGCCHLHVERKG